MSEKLRCGVIGLGILGSKHVQCLCARPDTEVVAVADVRAEVAQAAAAQAQAKPYTDYHEMLRQERLDLVVVATPDPLHREPTVAALEAGVPNVLLEKPLATTLEDAEAICNAVERRGARLFVNFANRAAPMDMATRYCIQRGLLGPVVYGEARVDDNISVPTRMWGARSREWAAGSSTAHFLLSHVVDLLRWYFSPAEVQEVYAISQKEILGYTPDLYDAYLTFDTGLKVRIKAEWTKHIDELVEFYLCFSGAEGTLIYNKLPAFGVQAGWRANLSPKVGMAELLAHQEALVKAGASVAAMFMWSQPSTGELAAGEGQLRPCLEYRGPCAASPTALVGYIIEAIKAASTVAASAPLLGPLPTHLDGWRQTQVVSAIVRSAESGRPVTLG